MINTNRVSKRYKKTQALNQVSIEINDSLVYGIIGPNGSGKSTLIKIITDLIRNFDGEVELQDIKYTDISLASEEFGFPSYYSVKKVLKLFSVQKKASEAEVEQVLKRLELVQHLNKNVKALSQGLKQRLNIACALLGQSKIIILDEPNNGLDPSGFIMLREIISELKEKGITVIIASHLLSELEQVCDEVIFLKNGHKIIQSKSEDLLAEYQSFEKAYLTLTS